MTIDSEGRDGWHIYTLQYQVLNYALQVFDSPWEAKRVGPVFCGVSELSAVCWVNSTYNQKRIKLI